MTPSPASPPPASLSVAVVTMLFPSPSETFISARLQTLTERGARVRVHALRARHPSAEALVEQRRLSAIPTQHNSVARSVRGVWHALSRPCSLAAVLRHAALPSWRKPKQFVRTLMYLPRAFDVLADLERDPPDVVHLAWGHYPSLVGMMVQRSLPQVATSVSLIAYDLTMEFAGTVAASRHADLVRTQALVNVPLISRFTGLPPEQIGIVYDGVDVGKIEALAGDVARVPGRILTAGRLVTAKGMVEAMQAFALVAKEIEHATFRVLGEGPLKPTLERLAASLGIADRVTFLGHVAHERVIQEMAAAESFLFMTHRERLPNVIKEAMACGSVCITTRTIGIEELVEDGVTGFLVDQGAIEDAARIAIAVANGRLDTITMRDAARRHVERRFDHDDNVKRLLSMWHACVENRRKLIAAGHPTTRRRRCLEPIGSPSSGS